MGLRPATGLRAAPGRLLPLLLALQALALAMGVGALQTVRGRLEACAADRGEASATTSQELAALRRRAEGLGAQLEALRRAAHAPAREEALFLKVLLLKPGVDHALARRIARAVHAECARAGQDPNLVLSIMAVESGFDPDAVSSAGAEGLMQVMPLWKKPLGIERLREPEASIRAGVHILTAYQQRFGDLALTLTAYSRGPEAVSGLLEAGEPAPGGYSAKVLGLWQRLRALDAVASTPG